MHIIIGLHEFSGQALHRQALRPHGLHPLTNSNSVLRCLVYFETFFVASPSVMLQVQEVGDGNINFVYIVKGPKGALCLKQGLPFVRIAQDWPLTQVPCPDYPPAPALPYLFGSVFMSSA